MIPDPREVADYVDRAERIVISSSGRLCRLTAPDRRRLIAEEVFAAYRRDGHEPAQLVPTPHGR